MTSLQPAPLLNFIVHRSAKNFAHDCLPFLKKEFYGEIPNLISKRSDGRTRWRMGAERSPQRSRGITPWLSTLDDAPFRRRGHS
jgi:hypothetical protein